MMGWLVRRLPLEADRERARVLALAVAVGALGGGSAVAFQFAVDAISTLVLGQPDPAMGGVSLERALLGPIVTGIGAGVAATVLTTNGRPQGIPEIIGHARALDAPPVPRNAVASAVASALTLGGGQSVGREGPIVQIAGSAAAFLCERLHVPLPMARVLSAAAAAGAIAASFNSPLGGAFFALEVILGSFALGSFAPVVVASVTGTIVGQLVLGDRLALQLPAFRLSHWSEVLLFPLVGVACGLSTIVFRWLVRTSQEQLARLPGPPFLRPGLAGLAVALCAALGLPDVMGNGYVRLAALVGTENPGLGFLATLLVAKIGATALSAASRSSGGMFAPSMFIGAVTGLACGRLAGLAGADPDPGTFAIAGMAGVAAAFAHAPATMTFAMAEMTGNYAITLPILVTVTISSLVTRAVYPHSLYVQTLVDRGLRLGDPSLARIENTVDDQRTTDLVELPDGFALRPLPAGSMAGRTLAELDLPRRYGLMVLAVDVWDEAEQRPRRTAPSADLRVGERDALLVIGPAAGLDDLASAG